MRKKIALILIGSCNVFCFSQSGTNRCKPSSFLYHNKAAMVQQLFMQFLTNSTQSREQLLSSPTSIVDTYSKDEKDSNQSELKIVVDKDVQQASSDCPVTPIATPNGSLVDLVILESASSHSLSDCIVESPRGKTPMNDSQELLATISFVRSRSLRECVVESPRPQPLQENLEEDYDHFCDVENDISVLSPSARIRRRSTSSEGNGIRSFRSQNFESNDSLGSCYFGSSSSAMLRDCPVPTPSPLVSLE